MKRYHLIVVGGGLTGVAAAVAGAREGLEVLLIERTGSLGGAMSNSLVYPFMQYWDKDPVSGKTRCLSAGIFTEMRRRQLEKAAGSPTDALRGAPEGADASAGVSPGQWERAENPHHGVCGLPERSAGREDNVRRDLEPERFRLEPEYFKLALDDMVTEAEVDVLFHGTVCQVASENRTLKTVEIYTKSGILTAEADSFADCTGDGELFFLAGCEYQLGRPEDGLCQPMTTCFRMGNVDMELFGQERDHIQTLYRQYQAEGKLKNPRENILVFFGLGEGVIHFNTTRILRHDPADAFSLSRAETEGRRQVYEMVDFLRNHFRAFAKSTLLSIASEIGVRESRKLKGVHVLTAQELLECVDFEDGVALGNYAIDIHNPSGTGTRIQYPKEGGYYQIPYRSLLPKEYDNLLVAGRCISATHEAQAAIRIMPICACLGEAAGIGAGIAARMGAPVSGIPVEELRRKLRKNGVPL